MFIAFNLKHFLLIIGGIVLVILVFRASRKSR
jgi:hypothetical protein